ncbi:hypothetical protein [Halolamina salifodinae]|uniref:Uncharacterized protein n=1 Tax=Halolamina salifodinae TaxID=1202767 RepID=A0A8T4H1T9_9EURY|nr:hypothetical protein [Halolamina salifodinae]MBP1988313.1 hypothetical protein [Halolamina salifodinae]
MTPPTEIRTKRGQASFVDGTVRFQESIAGYVRALIRDYWHGGSLGQRGIVGAYFFAILYGLGVLAWELGHARWRLPGLVVGVVVVGALIGRARGYRSVDSLDLDRIESVTATRGSKGFTRPRLVLRFQADGKTRKRRLLLPSRFAVDGDEAFERAVAAFEERGFDVDRDR